MKRISSALFMGIGIWVSGCNNNATYNPSSPADRIVLLKAKADSLYNRNEYGQAITCFDTLIANDSMNGEYYFKRGYSEAQVFKYRESTNDYLEAARLGHRKASAYFNVGLNYSIVNDSMALIYFEKSLKEDPGHVKAAEKVEELKKGLLHKGEYFRRTDNKTATDTGYRTL